MRRYLPNPYLSAAVLSWGFNFVAVKLLYQVMVPASLALTRFVVMYAALIPICWVCKESLRYPDRAKTLRILGIGALSMGVYMVFFLEGLQRCNPGDASILLATSPIWTMVIEVVLKQDVFRPGAIFGGLVALTGVGVVVSQATSSGGTSLLEVGLMLISAVCWAASVALSKPLLKDHSPLALITMSMPGALMVLIPYGLFPALETPWMTLSLVQWGYFLHLSLMAGALGFFGFFTGVRQVGPSGAMLYQFFVPVFAVITANQVLGEPITLQKVIGILIVIGGVAISSRARLNAAKDQKILPSAE